MAAAAGQFALAGAISSGGNAALGGASFKDAIGQGIVGASTSVLGGIVSGPISGVVSTQLSKVVGSTAREIATQVVTSGIVGGGFGAGMSLMNGGSPWQGFLSGMRMGAITGAISSGVPAAINALVKPNPFIPREVDTRTVDLSPEIKTELPDPPQINKKQNPINIGPLPRDLRVVL